MNSLYRAIIALSTVIPLTIPFAFVFSDVWKDDLIDILPQCCLWVDPVIVGLIIVVVLNAVIGYVMVAFLDWLANEYLGSNPVHVESVKMLGGDSMMGYLPYVLPLFITQSQMQPLLGWVVGAIVLLLLSLLSSTIPFSPLLKVCGLQFYEAELSDKRIVTLLIRDKTLRPLRLKKSVMISDFCIYGVR